MELKDMMEKKNPNLKRSHMIRVHLQNSLQKVKSMEMENRGVAVRVWRWWGRRCCAVTMKGYHEGDLW